MIFGAALLTGLFLAASPSLHAAPSTISRKLNKIAVEITKEFKTKYPDRAGTVLAVFPFTSDRELERRRVGFAVSELLQQHFVKTSDFRVVERTDLNRVMEEQELQQTGAVLPETAAKIGKLLGAQALLLGSVEKLGENYHVTARIIDIESGEVLALGYGEVAAELFETEAGSYLSLAPDEQGIGLFIFYNYRHSSNSIPPSQGTRWGYPYTVEPKAFDLNMVGGGIRYFPKKSFAVEASGSVSIKSPRVANTPNLIGTTGSVALKTVIMIRAAAFWVPRFTSNSRTYFGLGLVGYQAGQDSGIIDFYTAVTPSVRIGSELKIQKRLGLAFFANYDLISKTGVLTTGDEAIRLGKFQIEPSIALYF